MDDMAGTGHRAGAAAQTPLIVDDRVELLHMDGIGRTLFHAQAAGDAAHVARRPCAGLCGWVEALVPVGAQHRDTVSLPPQGNDPLGTLAGTRAAADALLLVHFGAAQIVDADGVEFACRYACTAADAAIGAEPLAVFIFLGATAAAAMDSHRLWWEFTFDGHVSLILVSSN